MESKKRRYIGAQLDLELAQYYLVHRDDIEKIDSLLGALNLAITEILESRPVRQSRWRSTSAQTDYDNAIGVILYRNDPVEF